MAEPEKPFACSLPDCGMTFTNEDHLTVHTKKHDMYLQLGLEQKAAFVADQTPTPTRFIRNCEEVGLFQDLQNVNPFEEGFKRAMETCKHGLLSLENIPSTTSDDLHTPQMIFPTLDNGDSTLYTRNNQKNITISRSSSDESGTVKEYETTTISKLTNQVTTISRVVNKHDAAEKAGDDANAKEDTCQKEETSVSYTNNVIKIHNNIEIRKDNSINVDTTKNVPINIVSYADTVIKDAVITKDVLLATTKAHVETKMPPIMSQKSLDFVVESLTSDMCQNHNNKPEVKIRNRKCAKQLPKICPATMNLPNRTCTTNIDVKTNNVGSKDEDYEVIIKLANGTQVRMKAVEETDTPENAKTENDTKEKLKLAINKKVSQKNNVYQRLSSITPVQGILPITGTLIPITIVNPTAQLVHKIPIAPYHHVTKPTQEFKKTVKRKTVGSNSDHVFGNANCSDIQVDDDCVIVNNIGAPNKRSKEDLDMRVAASRRYRARLRDTMRRQVTDIKQLKEANARLVAEKAVLKLLITEHMKRCPNAEDLRSTQQKLSQLPADS